MGQESTRIVKGFTVNRMVDGYTALYERALCRKIVSAHYVIPRRPSWWASRVILHCCAANRASWLLKPNDLTSHNSMMNSRLAILNLMASGDRQSAGTCFRGLLDLVRRKQTPPAMLLDVGCAHGGLVREAGAIGYSAFGLDLSLGELKAADRESIGNKLTLGTLAQSPFHPTSFDAVTMFDYIEHSLTPGLDAKQLGNTQARWRSSALHRQLRQS